MIAPCRYAQLSHDVPHGLHVEFCSLDDDRDIALATARASLSSTEQARAARFRFEHDRSRYIRGRGFMRRALGHCLGLPPADVPLIEEHNAKPALACQGPGFNLSHSKGLAVLAINDNGPVGVDLELENRRIDPLSVAPGCFQAHEIDALTALPKAKQRARFLTFWTAKEALMKLTGAGMSLDPKSIALRLQDGHPTGFDAPAGHRAVELTLPDLGPDHFIALASMPHKTRAKL